MIKSTLDVVQYKDTTNASLPGYQHRKTLSPGFPKSFASQSSSMAKSLTFSWHVSLISSSERMGDILILKPAWKYVHGRSKWQ